MGCWSSWARKARLGISGPRATGSSRDEMSLAKGRAFSARSGPLGTCESAACRRPFQKMRNHDGRYVTVTFNRFTRNLLLIVLLSVQRIFWVKCSMLLWKNCFDNIQEVSYLLQMLIKRNVQMLPVLKSARPRLPGYSGWHLNWRYQ